MRKSVKYIALLMGVSSLASCSSDFLNQNPTNYIPTEIVATPENAGRVFIGSWYYLLETMSSQANYGYRSLMSADDVMGNDVALAGNTYSLGDAYKFIDVSSKTSSRSAFAWALLYKTIDNCNTVITLQANENQNTKAFQYAQGHALTLRAFCYQFLVQHYQFTYLKDKTALCVPLYTEPTTPATKPKARVSVEAIYTQILEDLTLAKEKLAGYKNGTDQEKYKPTVNVVNGLLARTYLVMGEWEMAVSSAKAAQEGFVLMEPEAYQGFNDITNKEWIWGHPQSPTQKNSSYYGFSYLDVTRKSGYCSMLADPLYKDLFTQGDVRRELFQWMRVGSLGYRKFITKADETADIVLMRAAEMFLIEAEGMARLDNFTLDDAVKPLNALRTKRQVSEYDLTGKTKQNLIEEILLERRRELWGEGFSLTDILRTQKAVERVKIGDDYKKTIEGIKLAEDGKTYVVSCWQATGDKPFIDKEPVGHTTVTLPNAGDNQFVPNSIYYLYAIPEKETNANPEI